MMYLFSKTGSQLLESLSFTNTLYAFDFDGTLSRIVRNPEDAVISQRFEGLIKKLSERVPVAIISGRGLEDLDSKFTFRPNYLVGNHGLEGLSKVVHRQEIFKEISSNWKAQIQKEISDNRGNFEGVEIEDKSFSLALHYRKSRSKGLSKRHLLRIVDGLEPSPRIILGKCVVNLVPVGGPHKGMALLQALTHSGCNQAFYIGDDYTDEDVFTLPDARIFTVRVGEKSASNAKYFVRNQSEVGRLLTTILSFYKNDQVRDGAQLR
jgi:trehalose 6-phosphate phosphatase